MSLRMHWLTVPIAVIVAGSLMVPQGGGVAREIAVTIDDLPTASVLGADLPRAQQTTRDLVAALRRHRVPAVGFVNEVKLEDGGVVNPARVALLRQWVDAGLELGNHGRSHRDMHLVPLPEYKADVLAGEKTIRPLLEAAGRPLKYFRHPLLHTGRSLEARADFESLLKEHGYRVAPVTMDNYDYIFAAAYDRAGARGDAAAQQKIVDDYLRYMDAIFAYYEAQSEALVGRPMRHTLLLHANALNARAFDALAQRLVARGYAFVTLDRALEDPAYARRDEYVGPAGITWLHRWALTDGRPGSVFAGEPVVPEWVRKLSGV